MSNSVANRTLELACTVGAVDDALEAIEDGAELNCNGNSPVFLAILNKNRNLLNLLIDHGAETDSFLARKRLDLIRSREDLIEELIACAPHNPRDVRPEKIEEIDTGIRNGGVEFLLAEVDWDHATGFRDSLDAIGAGSSHRCVAEFLQWAQTEHGLQRNGLGNFLSENKHAIEEYRERYLSSGENLFELANDYLSEDDLK